MAYLKSIVSLRKIAEATTSRWRGATRARTSGYGGKDEQSSMPEFTKWTPDGHLRHSSFAGLRDDKDPLLIVRESALAERNPYESVTTSRLLSA